MGGVGGLDYQLAAVKFTKGLDTKSQQKLVIPGKWNALDNLTLTEDDTPQRRDGVTSLVSGRTGNGLATWNDQLLAINNKSLYAVSRANTTAAAVLSSGNVGFVGIGKREVSRPAALKLTADCAVGATSAGRNLACYVWAETDIATGTMANIRVSVVEQSTGTFLLRDEVVAASATAVYPRVVFGGNAMGTGGAFYIFWIDTGSTTLNCRTILTSSPSTLNATVALVTSANLWAIPFDCCGFGTNAGDTTAMVSYAWNDGVTSVRSIKVQHAAGVPSIGAGPTNLITAAAAATAFLEGISTVTDGTVGATFALSSAVGIAAATINSAWAVQATGVPIGGAFAPPFPALLEPYAQICAVKRSDNRFQVFWDCRSRGTTADASDPLYTVVIDSALAVFDGPHTSVYSSAWSGGATDPLSPRGPYIGGKPFTSGSNVLLPVVTVEGWGSAASAATNNQQNATFILDCTETSAATTTLANPVGHALYGSTGVITSPALQPFMGGPCSTPADGSSNLLCVFEYTILSSTIAESQTGVVSLVLTPNTANAPSRAQLGESTYLAGGNLTNYDGSRCHEHPFLMFPEGVRLEAVVGGGNVAAGTYQVVCIYETIDNAGQRHQSAPSLPSSITIAGPNDRIRVRAPTLHLTQLGTAVNIVAFITQNAGLTFTRATVGAFSSGTPNDPTVREVTFDIGGPVTSYASNEALYTQPLQAGTVLPNVGPSPCNGIVVHQNRLFFDRADQPFTFGFSQPFVNNVGLRFNDQLGGTWPSEAGDFKGWASIDEKLVLFTERKPFVIYGTGPNLAGAFSNYSDPQEVPTDVGCKDARSIVETPAGVIFKSQKGFYLLGRDMAVRYIGEGVASFDSYTITGAVLLEDRQEVRFTTDSSVHPTLIYSYLVDQWSTTSFQDTYTMLDAAWWSTTGAFVAIDATYGIQTDWTSKYDNFGAAPQPIYWTARTSFLHVAEIGGFQRARWAFLTGTGQTANPMGGNSPQSDLVWTVYLNDVYGTAAYSFTVDLNTISFAAPTEALDIRHKLQQQKCKSIAFQWSDQPSAADAQSGYQVAGIQALTLEVGLRRGTHKLPAAQGVS